ncbi:MAG: hypothetical protein FWD58_10685, partial [Firmicutes bacterium]|nr:hypothetical protein [Bacillota bacterium]
ESTEAHLDKLNGEFADSRNSSEKTESFLVERAENVAAKIEPQPKPKTLEEKLNAAKEKVKAQDTQGNKNKIPKREERE